MNSVEILTMPENESPLEWNRAHANLADLEETCGEPPIVIRVTKDRSGAKFRGQLDTTKPLLVYSKRRRSKLCAESVQWNKKKAKYLPVPHGQQLEIPKDYAGWFQMAQGAGPEKDDGRHHATIESVSKTGCEYFLTRTQIAALSGETNIDGKLELQGEVKLYPGEIIKVEACVGRRWKARGKDGDAKKQHETKFLKCTDFHGRELYLPYAHPGIFHAVVEDDVNLDDPSVVYQLEDLIKQERKLPMVVKLIFGWPPKKSVEFHGYIRLLFIRRPDTFVVQGFGSTAQSFAEIPLNIDWRVQSLLNIEKLKGSAMFNETMERCRADVYPFLTSIKTLTIQYKCLDDSDGDNDDDDGRPRRRKSSGNKAFIDRLTDPVDMSDFNPLNIYPPADLDDGQDNVSESWSLSFRDPKPVSPVSKHLYQHKDNAIGEEEPWVMTEEGSASGQGSMVRIGQKSAMYKQDNKRGSIANFTNETDAMIRKNDLRVIKDRSKSKREAKC